MQTGIVEIVGKEALQLQIDETMHETKPHGTEAFPFQCYHIYIEWSYPVRPGDAVVCNSGMAHGMKSDTRNGFRCIRIEAPQVQFPHMQENCLVPLS